MSSASIGISPALLLRACRREPVPHTPVWFMRQAGRSLPEYRAARAGIRMLDACRDHHYNLVLAPVGSARQRKAEDLKVVFEHFAPDGVVLIPPLTDDPAVLEFLEQQEVPFACIAPKRTEGRIGVMMDETSAVLELMAGLVAQGHRRIAHIKGPPAHGACQWRYKGYRDALKKAGIEYDPALVVQGAFSFLLMAKDRLIAVRDPHGFRPLALGRLGDAWVVCSETCAMDLIGATYERDVSPGEVLVISAEGTRSLKPFPPAPLAHCVFEHVYFARPDSYVFGRSVNEIRTNLGRIAPSHA